MHRLLFCFFFSFIVFDVINSQSNTLNVLSYNIRLPYKGDGENYWDLRRSRVDSMIIKNDADILGVQEAYRRQLEEITEDLPQYEWFGVCRTDGSMTPDPDNEFSAILYLKDRFTRLDGGTFWLSVTPDVAGSKSWDAAYPRIVTWVHLLDKRSKKSFFHFNTHFDHMGVEARQESAKLLLRKIDAIAGNEMVIVTGDFNFPPGEIPYQLLTATENAQHLTDACTVSIFAPQGPKSTFAGNFRLDGLEERERIDYIFVKNGPKVLYHRIDDTHWEGRLASDHLAVFAQIKF